MAIFEPYRYETEEILRIPLPPGNERCYVISGFADFSWTENPWGAPLGDVEGDTHDDKKWVTHHLYIPIGPEVHDVKDVSPTAGIAGWSFKDSDETDWTGIELENCRWDTIGSTTNTGRERIRLKVKLRMCGGLNSNVTKISYHVTALVTELAILG